MRCRLRFHWVPSISPSLPRARSLGPSASLGFLAPTISPSPGPAARAPHPTAPTASGTLDAAEVTGTGARIVISMACGGMRLSARRARTGAHKGSCVSRKATARSMRGGARCAWQPSGSQGHLVTEFQANRSKRDNVQQDKRASANPCRIHVLCRCAHLRLESCRALL